MSAVTDTSEQRSDLTQCADNFLPTFKALERSKTLPPACLFEPEQEDRCSRKTHTKPKTVNLCSHSSSARLFWKHSTCFEHVLRSERKFKDVFFQHHNSCTRFPQMKARDPDCRSVTRVSVRSLWPPSMWLSYPTNLCHRIIVFKGSAHWQMMCDQFCNNATCLPWEMKSWHFIQLEVEWTCCVELKVTLILINVQLYALTHTSDDYPLYI